ncbi:hypothetical protein BT93_B1423 [Corymbia citriodora subsp. variegata]|nr:hypothetical protein BT93_B1423 [Corymbia citriodora subsp. variegata]KAF8038864.1 hypothetical protein BT93_B1423 [Corymbia citriodora subsp. variegata]
MLQGGIGFLHNLIITDNSSWMRCRKFRLGARAVQKVSAEIRIREARSETFVVKDHRGVLNKKHHPPSLSDEVWRLEKVAKHGPLHKRMISRGINTVQDFLQLYEADASSLRNILGNRVANRIWEMIVKHARTCVVDDYKMYAYFQASNQASILFNSVMKVDQATLDGQTYQSLDQLTHSQKNLVQSLRRQAYHNKNQWVPLDALPSITPPSALTDLPTESLIGLSPLVHQLDHSMPNQENAPLDCLDPQNHIITNIIDQRAAKSIARQDFLSDFSAGESNHHPGFSHGPFAPNRSSPEELFKAPSPIPGNLMGTPEHTFITGSSSRAGFRICPSGTGFRVGNSRISKPRAAWCKIRAVVKWGAIRHVVAAKRTAMFNWAHY